MQGRGLGADLLGRAVSFCDERGYERIWLTTFAGLDAARALYERHGFVLTGETGTGKGLVARILHHAGRRAEGPLIEVNCAALPRELLESELFGHEAGAFTGAKGRHRGLMEQANGGTLFLDEIGNLSMPLQSKLLTVLQKREVTRIGTNKPIPVDIRLICATNMPLHDMIMDSTFRQDLLYRINTVEIFLPPLRDRGGEVYRFEAGDQLNGVCCRVYVLVGWWV
jgi:transcriptional regulator with PAS, ATPase and Fis domain